MGTSILFGIGFGLFVSFMIVGLIACGIENDVSKACGVILSLIELIVGLVLIAVGSIRLALGEGVNDIGMFVGCFLATMSISSLVAIVIAAIDHFLTSSKKA